MFKQEKAAELKSPAAYLERKLTPW